MICRIIAVLLSARMFEEDRFWHCAEYKSHPPFLSNLYKGPHGEIIHFEIYMTQANTNRWRTWTNERQPQAAACQQPTLPSTFKIHVLMMICSFVGHVITRETTVHDSVSKQPHREAEQHTHRVVLCMQNQRTTITKKRLCCVFQAGLCLSGDLWVWQCKARCRARCKCVTVVYKYYWNNWFIHTLLLVY